MLQQVRCVKSEAMLHRDATSATVAIIVDSMVSYAGIHSCVLSDRGLSPRMQQTLSTTVKLERKELISHELVVYTHECECC